MEIKLLADHVSAVSSSGSCNSATLTYLVSGAVPGSTGGLAALQGVRGSAPLAIGNAQRKNIAITRYRGSGVYEIEVQYRKSESTRHNTAVNGDRHWRFDVSARKLHTEEALSLVSTVAGEFTHTPAPGCLVGWNGKSGADCRISGVDILSPEMRESCVATFLSSHVTSSYKAGVMRLVGKVNSAAFHGWNAGEVLFLGAVQGEEYENASGNALIDITFHFAVRSNSATRTINGISVGNVAGWDHVWSITAPDPATRELKIAGIYVSRLYEAASFAALDL